MMTMLRSLLARKNPLFYRPPALAALRLANRLPGRKTPPVLENAALLPVDRPYFLLVESDDFNAMLLLLEAWARAVPYRGAAFWLPSGGVGAAWMRAVAMLANGMSIPEDADILTAMMTPLLRRPPTWAETTAVLARMRGEPADEDVLAASQIQAFFASFGTVEAARMAFDRQRARALEEIVLAHREAMLQKNCAVITAWKREGGTVAVRIPLWMVVAQAVAAPVFPVSRMEDAKGRTVFSVRAAMGGQERSVDPAEPDWIQAARRTWESFQNARQGEP